MTDNAAAIADAVDQLEASRGRVIAQLEEFFSEPQAQQHPTIQQVTAQIIESAHREALISELVELVAGPPESLERIHFDMACAAKVEAVAGQIIEQKRQVLAQAVALDQERKRQAALQGNLKGMPVMPPANLLRRP